MRAEAVHRIVPAPSEEDAERADLYAVLAHLWRQAPDARFLQTLAAQAAETGSRPAEAADGQQSTPALAAAWQALCEAAASESPQHVAEEYASTFGGVGRPEVFLHGSYYLAGFLHERPLAELRARLAALGLSRSDQLAETEDHVALLCETMRYLIRSPDAALSAAPVQHEFFHAHLGSWSDALVDAVEASPSARFYKHVARMMRAFFDVERQAFDIE